VNDLSDELEVAKAIAGQAGEIMLEFFNDDQKVERKSDDSPVTIADTRINSMVIEELKKAFPKDDVIGEEESRGGYGLGRKWFCDPIDGTKAYTWGVPTAMFSLGFAIDGVPMVGVAYDPFLDKLYAGIKHGGSTCNGQKLKVSADSIEAGSVAITARVELIAAGLKYVERLQKRGVRLVSFSGCVYKASLIAKGKLAGYIAAGVSAYDVAAIHVIVEEAGGKVTGLDGQPIDYTRPFKDALISNGTIHKDLLEACAT